MEQTILMMVGNTLHYSTDELCSAALTSDSISSTRISAPACFILNLPTAPINTTHRLGNVMHVYFHSTVLISIILPWWIWILTRWAAQKQLWRNQKVGIGGLLQTQVYISTLSTAFYTSPTIRLLSRTHKLLSKHHNMEITRLYDSM